jgi:hypothetical protein
MSLSQSMGDPSFAAITWRQKNKYLPRTPSSDHAFFNLTGDITVFRTHQNVEKKIINGIQAFRNDQYVDDNYLSSIQLHPYVNAPLTKKSMFLPNLMSVNPLAGSNYLGPDMITKSNNPLNFANTTDLNFQDTLDHEYVDPSDPLSAHYAAVIHARRSGDTFNSPETQHIIDDNKMFLLPHVTNILTGQISAQSNEYNSVNNSVDRGSVANNAANRFTRSQAYGLNGLPMSGENTTNPLNHLNDDTGGHFGRIDNPVEENEQHGPFSVIPWNPSQPVDDIPTYLNSNHFTTQSARIRNPAHRAQFERIYHLHHLAAQRTHYIYSSLQTIAANNQDRSFSVNPTFTHHTDNRNQAIHNLIQPIPTDPDDQASDLVHSGYIASHTLEQIRSLSRSIASSRSSSSSYPVSTVYSDSSYVQPNYYNTFNGNEHLLHRRPSGSIKSSASSGNSLRSLRSLSSRSSYVAPNYLPPSNTVSREPSEFKFNAENYSQRRASEYQYDGNQKCNIVSGGTSAYGTAPLGNFDEIYENKFSQPENIGDYFSKPFAVTPSTSAKNDSKKSHSDTISELLSLRKLSENNSRTNSSSNISDNQSEKYVFAIQSLMNHVTKGLTKNKFTAPPLHSYDDNQSKGVDRFYMNLSELKPKKIIEQFMDPRDVLEQFVNDPSVYMKENFPIIQGVIGVANVLHDMMKPTGPKPESTIYVMTESDYDADLAESILPIVTPSGTTSEKGVSVVGGINPYLHSSALSVGPTKRGRSTKSSSSIASSQILTKRVKWNEQFDRTSDKSSEFEYDPSQLSQRRTSLYENDFYVEPNNSFTPATFSSTIIEPTSIPIAESNEPIPLLPKTIKQNIDPIEDLWRGLNADKYYEREGDEELYDSKEYQARYGGARQFAFRSEIEAENNNKETITTPVQPINTPEQQVDQDAIHIQNMGDEIAKQYRNRSTESQPIMNQNTFYHTMGNYVISKTQMADRYEMNDILKTIYRFSGMTYIPDDTFYKFTGINNSERNKLYRQFVTISGAGKPRHPYDEKKEYRQPTQIAPPEIILLFFYIVTNKVSPYHSKSVGKQF